MQIASVLMLSLMLIMIAVSPLGLVSPSAILSGSWGAVFLLQSIFAADMQSSFLATIAILSITMAFCVGEILGCGVHIGKKYWYKNAMQFPLTSPIELRHEKKFRQVVIVFGLFSIAGSIQYANALHLFEASNLAELVLLPGAAREKIFSGELSVSLFSRIGFLLAYSGVVLSLSYYYIYKWHWWLTLPMIAVLILGASQSGRAGVMIVVLQIMIVMYLKNTIVIGKKASSFFLGKALFPLVLLVFIFIGGQLLREGFGSSDFNDIYRVVDSLRGYLFGGVSAFSFWFDNIYEPGMPTFGVYSFSSFFDVIGVFPQAPGVYDQYLPIALTNETSNLYTAYRSFIDDFTIIGACIFYLSAGFFTARAGLRLVNGEKIFVLLLIPVLAFLTYSPMSSLTYFNSFLLSCLLPFLVVKNVVRL